MQRVLLAVTLFLIGQLPSQQSTDGALIGRALRTDTGAAISNVPIAVIQVSPNGNRFTAVTDNAGRFSLNNIPAGRYLIEAAIDGYIEGWGAGASTSTIPIPVEVRAQARTEMPSFYFIPGATVSGQILDSDGRTPLVGGTVEVVRRYYNSAASSIALQAIGEGLLTDDRGEYRIHSLPPGNYLVRLQKRPRASGGPVSDGDLGNPPQAKADRVSMIYYPGVGEAARAVTIAMKSGEDVRASFSIPSDATFKVSGRVINAASGLSSLPATSLVVVASGKDQLIEKGNPAVLTLPAGSDGRFELSGLYPGSYELLASAWKPVVAGQLRRSVITSRTSFTIRDKDLDGVAIALQDSVDVRVKVTMPGGNASEFHILASGAGGSESGGGGGGGGFTGSNNTIVRVNLLSASSSLVGSTGARLEADTLIFDGIPAGSYSMQVSVGGTNKRTYISEIRQGATSVVDKKLVVGASPPELVEVIIETNAGSVRAKIKSKGELPVQGKPETPLLVVLVPESPHRANLLFYKTVSVNDASNPVLISGVAPGTYMLFAWEQIPGHTIPYLDPDFISKYTGRSAVVRVQAGAETGGIELAIIPIGQ